MPIFPSLLFPLASTRMTNTNLFHDILLFTSQVANVAQFARLTGLLFHDYLCFLFYLVNVRLQHNHFVFL